MSSLNTSVPHNSPLHRALVQEVMARRQFAVRSLSDRWTAWREADERQQMHITEREADRVKKQSKKSNGILDYVQVEIPYSFGMMMAQQSLVDQV